VRLHGAQADDSIAAAIRPNPFAEVMTTSNPRVTHSRLLERARSAGFFRARWLVGVVAVALVAVGAYLFFARNGDAQSPGGKADKTAAAARSVPVVAAPAKTGDIGVYLTGLGSVTPLNTVTVKSRVDGQIMQVLFKEGQVVHVGDLLAQIDPRPFQVQLEQAEGQLARDLALLKNAQLDLERYRILVEEDSAPKQQLDTQASLVRQYEGAVKVDQGQVDNAKLQLTYSRITAPITGTIGLRLVDAGNIVHATDTTGLAVITQLQPITVVFTIPEDSLPQVMKKLRAGEHLVVEAYDREQRNKLAIGYLLTADNQIDPTTGTVRLKAKFDNEDGVLFPNQFVNARLLLDVKKGATVVPTVAIQRGAQGPYVYVVKPDQTVSVHQVTVGATQGDDVAVDTGVSPGDLVVVDGADKLKDGTKVDLQPGDGGARQRGKAAKPGKA
jgi:membrane fusion protein, multidrug efflux system